MSRELLNRALSGGLDPDFSDESAQLIISVTPELCRTAAEAAKEAAFHVAANDMLKADQLSQRMAKKLIAISLARQAAGVPRIQLMLGGVNHLRMS